MTLEEMATVAVFMASDKASGMTGTSVNDGEPGRLAGGAELLDSDCLRIEAGLHQQCFGELREPGRAADVGQLARRRGAGPALRWLVGRARATPVEKRV